jgi:hypothetical protein
MVAPVFLAVSPFLERARGPVAQIDHFLIFGNGHNEF